MAKRWYPGHYLQAFDGSLRNGIDVTEANTIASNPRFAGVQVVIYWGQTETSYGDYTQLYVQLDACRAWAQATGKKIWLRLFERSFVDEDRPAPFPQYIRDTGDWYNLAMARAVGYTANERVYFPKLWKAGSLVRERFLVWAEKVAEYVRDNPEFVLVSNEEYGMAASWLFPDFNTTQFDTLWREFAVRMLAKMGDCLLHVNTGYSSLGSQSVAYYRALSDQLVAIGVQVLGPTDLRKDNEQGSAFLATDFGQFITNLPTASNRGYRGITAFASNYEWPDFASVDSPAEHLRWAVDELRLHFIAWDPDRGGSGGSARAWTWGDALDAVNGAGGRINTLKPSLVGTEPDPDPEPEPESPPLRTPLLSSFMLKTTSGQNTFGLMEAGTSNPGKPGRGRRPRILFY